MANCNASTALLDRVHDVEDAAMDVLSKLRRWFRGLAKIQDPELAARTT